MATKDRGSIFVMVAIILFGIIAFLALAIDTSIALASRTHLQQMARQIGFTAAEVASSPGKTFEDARVRAETVLTRNMGDYSMSRMRGGATNILGIMDDTGTVTTTGADSGWIQSGNWYFEEAAPDSDPCKVSGVFRPCFIPVDPATPGNAVRVRLWLNPTGLLKTIFGGKLWMSQSEMGVTGSATVALVPQYLLNMVDVSSSVTSQSHSTAKYTYRVPADNALFGGLAASRGADGSCSNHYQDDYFDTTVFSAAGVTNARFMIDQHCSPEPLSSILTGIDVAVDFLEARRMSADKFAAYGFDSIVSGGAAIYTRGTYVPNPSPGNPPFFHTMLPPDASLTLTGPLYQQIKDGIDLTKSITDPDRYERMLYPRNRGQTDMPLAVGVGMAQLEHAATFKTARRKMTFFSDGGSNCVPISCYTACVEASPAVPPSTPATAADPTTTACQDCLRHEVTDPMSATEIQAFIDSLTNNRLCQANATTPVGLAAVVASTDEFVRMFDGEVSGTKYDPMVDREVKVNIFQNGKRFGGQHIYYKNAAGTGCMSEAEVAAAGLDTTDYGAGPALAGVDTYYGSKLALAAKATGGRYAAVLEPCPGAPLASQLESACASSANTPPTPVDLQASALGLVPALAPFIAGPRLMCDPAGRTQAVQYQEEMEAALGGDTAFLAVE